MLSGKRWLAGCATEAVISVEANVITLTALGTEVSACVCADGVMKMPTWAEVGA